MVKRERVLLPKPRSSFLLVQCSNCSNEQVLFSNSTLTVKCSSCGAPIAQNTGGKAKILATVLKRLD
ncbi:MAG: 30S ribosomal protein S27e [Nitrososphaerales archaeon]